MRSVPRWKTLTIALATLLSLLYALPSFMGGVPAWWPKWLPSQVVSRGLDLQGGLYLLLHVEAEKAVEQSAENLVDDIRGVMREAKLRYGILERQGADSVQLKPAEGSDLPQLREVLKKQFPNLEIHEEPSAWRLRISDAEQKEIRRFAVDQSIQTIRSRVDQFGVSEPTIQRQGEERILIQLPGMKDPTRAKALIGRTARLEFKMVDEKGDLAAAVAGRVPPGDVVLYGEERAKDLRGKKSGSTPTRQPYLLKKRTVLTGDLLSDARVNFDPQFGEPNVSVTFNRQGARKFAQLTGEHVGERMAIILDGKVYSAPVIREKIDGGRAQISGSFTTDDAHDLAIVLRAGALPAPVEILEERTVGPTLGSDSIHDGLAASLIGAALVVVFMGFYYKGFGWLANLALALNMLILIASLALLQATLTLPGIAGAVLLMGMSVDANVLIFERIREELRLGKTPMAAIEHGYERAFLTIVDSNLTTIIIAVILFQFGTGPVRGFAVTLTLGLLISMFTAIFVTHVVVRLLIGDRRVKRLSV